MPRTLWTVPLGTLPYSAALELQRDVARRRISGDVPEDVLLLVEHPHVITLGRSSKQASLVLTPGLLESRGVELFEVERGGDVTYHGPGQLVGYPIIDLKQHRKDLHWHLRQIEEAIIQGVGEFGIPAHRAAGYTGVWVPALEGAPAQRAEGRKLASIGVHARDWVTWHGFALNVTTDLSYFELMVPCGIPEVEMTSVSAECARRGLPAPGLEAVQEAVSRAFGRLYDLEVTPVQQVP